jgi:hypothetical protein
VVLLRRNLAAAERTGLTAKLAKADARAAVMRREVETLRIRLGEALGDPAPRVEELARISQARGDLERAAARCR